MQRIYLLYGYDTEADRDFLIRLSVEQAVQYKKKHKGKKLFISAEERQVYKELKI